jgi:aspartate/methionine/tyrosine aminotransferase
MRAAYSARGIKMLAHLDKVALSRIVEIRDRLIAIVVFQGGMGALFCAINSVTNVIVARLVWGAIRNQVKLSGALLVEVDLHPELGFVWDAEELEATIRRTKPKALVFVNPSNPTSGVAPQELIIRLAELADRYGFYVVEDVAYEDIVYGEPIAMVRL